MTKQKLIKSIVLLVCVAVVGYVLLNVNFNRDKLDYNEHLSDVAVTIDGEEVTYQDLAFYLQRIIGTSILMTLSFKKRPKML